MDDKEWLKSLKVGDEVCYYSRWHGYAIEKIVKITPTGIIKTARHTWRDGSCKVDSWNYYNLEPITQKIRDAIRRKKSLQFAKSYDFEKLNLVQLGRLSELLEEFDLARSAIEPTEQAQADERG